MRSRRDVVPVFYFSLYDLVMHNAVLISYLYPMKIRIKDSSIRLRLSMADIESLKNTASVKANCQWADGANWEYSLSQAEENAIHAHASGIDVTLDADNLAIVISEDKEGTRLHIANGTEEGCLLVVEKDFQCLIPRSEDESNLYPNPKA